MSDFNYDHWWSLHLRVAKGEELSEAEQIAYRLGQVRLDMRADVPEQDTLAYLRTLRAAINRAVALHTSLTTSSADLEKEIVALETAYQRSTGHRLDLEPHATA